MRTRLRWAIAGLMCVAAVSALAQDKVRLRYLPAYPPPDLSSEVVEIEVGRISGYRRSRELDVDRYFAAIEKILADHRITSNWERVIVHAPSVHVDIDIGGKKLSLGSSYSANGLDIFPDQDGANERHRRALENILRLTTRRASMKSPVQ